MFTKTTRIVSNAAHLSAVLSALALAGLANNAHAGITGTSGSCTFLASPPLSALPGALMGPPAYCWNEQTNVNSASTVVNIAANGFYTGTFPYITAVSGLFDSHIVHFDALSGVANVTGSVTFNQNIVAVIYDETLLSVTDATFGNPGTVYPTGNAFRSMNGNALGNSWLNIVGNTLSFDLWAFAPANYMSQVRVLTHAVPTPGSIALIGMGGLAIARRRRN